MAEIEYPRIVPPVDDGEGTPSTSRYEPVLPADAVSPDASRPLTASFQLDVANAVGVRCPHCNKVNDGGGLLLDGVEVSLHKKGIFRGDGHPSGCRPAQASLAWSPTLVGDFHTPDRFGDLVFTDRVVP